MKDAEVLLQDADIELTSIENVSAETQEQLIKADTLFFDTETTGFSPWKSEIALIQLYDPKSRKVLLGRVPPEWRSNDFVNKLFSSNKTIVGHNIASFDIPFMHMHGTPWENSKYFDTLIGETICSTSGRRDVSKSLRESVRRRTGYKINKDIEHGGWRNPELSQEQKNYAAIDVLSLPDLYETHKQKAEETGQTKALEMEMEVLPVFARMTINGVPISQEALDGYMESMQEKMVESGKLLKKALGNINYNSPKQVLAALSNIGIELDSTAKPILQDIIQFDPEAPNAKLLQALLDWRKPSKRTSMYGSEEWQHEHIQYDGRIHSRFWQVGADTTRVSSSDPNLQQIPKDARYVIGNVPGLKIVSVDYSQIEVRIASALSGDTALGEVLDHDDVHSGIASQVFKKPPEKITPAERKLSKAMVFTLLFGGSWKVFYLYAKRSGSSMSEQEALELFRAFFEAFSGLWNMRQHAYALCRHKRVAVITLPNGARRVLAGNSLRPTIVLNTPVQGTAAVGMKYGLIEAHYRGLSKYLGAVVHDETVSAVPVNEAEDYAREMQDALVFGMKKVVKNVSVRAEIARLEDGSLPDYWLP